jgi:vacuolar-type H+-ATPase subunit F/Vma7
MAISRTIDRATMRQLAAAMALVMMMASLPSIGVIIICDRSAPSITLDICHPLQSLDASPAIVQIAGPAQPELGAKVVSRETVVQFVPILKCRFAEAPDPPPPKLFC